MIIEITSLQDERVAMFSTMTEAQLRNRLNIEQGIFISLSSRGFLVPLHFLP